MSKRNRNRDRNHNNQAPAPAPTSTSLSKADIARINGPKSHGPTSDAGKARSSQNAIKHGLSAKKFMGTPEEQAEFDLHLDAAISHWAPQSDYELYLVTKIARADFQHDRAESLQNTLIDLETDIIGAEIQRAFVSMTDTGALALGYKSLDEHSSAHRNLDRHIARLARERVQARKALAEAIEHRQKLEAAERAARQAAPPEPEPAPAPEPETQKLQSEPTAPATVTPIDTGRRPVPTPPATSHPVAFQNEPTPSADGTPNCPAA